MFRHRKNGGLELKRRDIMRSNIWFLHCTSEIDHNDRKIFMCYVPKRPFICLVLLIRHYLITITQAWSNRRSRCYVNKLAWLLASQRHLPRFKYYLFLIIYLIILGCQSGQFGRSCRHNCTCQNEARCDAETGACYCAQGWTGTTCSQGGLSNVIVVKCPFLDEAP